KENEAVKKEQIVIPPKQPQPIASVEKPKLKKKEEVLQEKVKQEVAPVAPSPAPQPVKPEAKMKEMAKDLFGMAVEKKEPIEKKLDKNGVNEKIEIPQPETKAPQKPIQLAFRSSKHRNEEKKETPAPVTLPPVVAEDPTVELPAPIKEIAQPGSKPSLMDLLAPSPLQPKQQPQAQQPRAAQSAPNQPQAHQQQQPQ